jgi:hypothetical protein
MAVTAWDEGPGSKGFGPFRFELGSTTRLSEASTFTTPKVLEVSKGIY